MAAGSGPYGSEQMVWGEEEAEEAPSFDDLIIDDTLSETEKIVRYSSSEYPLQRLIYVRAIGEAALTMSRDEVIEYFIPLLDALKEDDEPVVRQALADQYPVLARVLLGVSEEDADKIREEEVPAGIGYELVLQDLLPHLGQLLIDPVPQVRANASVALIQVSRQLSPSYRSQYLCDLLSRLANDAEEEEHRCASGQLANDMASLLGPEVCVDFAIPLVRQLAMDSCFRVRKAVAMSFGNICEVAGHEATEAELVPVWTRLAEDDIWGVRKACAESMVSLSKCLDEPNRGPIVIPQFISFTRDVSRWVRSAAFQHLGPLIATLTAEAVTEELLTYFTDMANPRNSASTDGDVSSFCAFNFPAVVLTVGPERWPNMLEAFTNLCQDVQWKVRRCLSHSIHELAKILGPELSKKHLLEPFMGFMGDLDEVKDGVVRNLSTFLGCLPRECIGEFLATVKSIQEERDNWRFRKELAKQMTSLCDVYDVEPVQETLLPICLALCRDNVARVRFYSHSAVGPLLAKIHGAGVDISSYVTEIKSLASSEHGANYQSRQMFLWIMKGVFEAIPRDVFDKEFLELVCQLGDDKVANVRICVAELLAHTLMKHRDYQDNATLTQMMNKLMEDKDRDVVYLSKLAASQPEEGEVV